MQMNLFPAILLAGPPHSGKSVLAFLLTQHLRAMGVAHYLLRAVPDGEGDWFLSGPELVVRTLRSRHKGSYSAEFIEHMLAAIRNRPLPMLVDVGGRPQGEQFGLIRACTHSILLHRTEEERAAWRTLLGDSGLIPIAELRSALGEKETVRARQPVLTGTISGLEREAERRTSGLVFGALLERVGGICSYEAQALEREHLRLAPFPVLNERELARRWSVPADGERTTWSPAHLRRIREELPPHAPGAIYGRGPVWLAAALAAHTLPEPCAIFDARYGWLFPPEVRFGTRGRNVKTKARPFMEGDTWLEIELPDVTLEPGRIVMETVEGQGGIALSGKLPRWLFTALARRFAPGHAWVAVDDPRFDRAIVVHSNSASVRAGDVLARLE
jgi:CRISPR-associated protein Csx3